MFLSWRRLCLPALALISVLAALSGCDRRPAKSPDTSETSGTTVTSGTSATTAAATAPAPTNPPGLQVSDGVNVHWYTLNRLQESSGEAEVPRVFSPHYSTAFTPQPDYGRLQSYVGLYAGYFPIYGLLDEQLRIVTPAIYGSLGGNNYITFLMGDTWKAEDDPRIDRIYTYDRQFESLYQKFTVIPYDGSWMLDDSYCFYEQIEDGYALFSLDGSLTLIDEKGKITQKLSGGDYCWVQPIETGRLFAFHGLDGTVTVRDRTGKTVSRFTKEQMGDDVRFTYPGSMPPEAELVWHKNIGYVQHYKDATGSFWTTRYLYADTGEVKKPPVKGLTRYDRITPDRVEFPAPESEPVPEAIQAYEQYCPVKDHVTGKFYYLTLDPSDIPAQSTESFWYSHNYLWDLRDSTGKCLLTDVVRTTLCVTNGYIKIVTEDDDTKTIVTRYIRVEDGSTAFYYQAHSDEADY